MTTELQPSPPGYRQDATVECPASNNAKIYHHHQRGYSSGGEYIQQQQSGGGGRRKGSSPETTTTGEVNGKIGGERFEDSSGYGKKNAPGYKNDSGYSESLGFESFSLALSERDAASPPPTPPVRDASSLKAVCYGPGHEKYPSWPSAPECRYPNANSNDEDDENQQQHGGSHRSKSWTDHTNYPKEKPAQYTRPHTKRPNSTFTQQLKTVMERCEKIPAETFEPRNTNDRPLTDPPPRMWPTVDREGKSLGDSDYMVPSPPERESLQSKTLSPADLEAYVRSYQDPQVYAETELTQTGLEEYTTVQHSQQASYAQSEGYHSYVSSVDSTTTTPFLDRLRRDSEAVTARPLSAWEDGSSREGRDSVVTTSSGSASSSETLKWHGSMSDVSVSSGIPRSTQDRWHHGSMSDLSSINGAPPSSKHDESHHHHHHRPAVMSKSFHALASNGSSVGDEWDGSKQLIAHSARVQTPQRHHSESVLYLERSQRKLYPVSTTKLDEETPSVQSRHLSSPPSTQPSVAERISELEKQQQHQQQMMRYTYLDPEKRHRVSDPTLKAIQKKALLSFYERHQHQASWRSEPHLIQNQQQQPSQQQRHSPPPQPPPRPRPASSRRASSASDYASGAWREKNAANKAVCQQQPPGSANGTTSASSNGTAEVSTPRHQHSNSCGSLSTDLLGPVIVGPAISIDDWVPERPPKKPHLRTAYSDRLPSPDLPPPSPPTVTDVEVINFDDPLPPPPPELSTESRLPSPEQRHENSYFEETAHERIRDRNSTSRRSSRKKLPMESSPTTSPTKLNSTSPNQDQPHSFHFECKTTITGSIAESKPVNENGFTSSSSRILSSARSSLRYSPAQKHLMNEKIAAVRRSAEAGYSLANQLPDLIAQKYSDSGNQRPAPQVPVVNSVSCRETQPEPKIKRQDSLKLDDSSSKNHHHQPWLSGQKPRVGNGAVTSPTSSRLGNKYQQQAARNYFALPTKYSPTEPNEAPPPLAPRKKISPPPRPAPPVHSLQGSQSKASYLAYRRERGAPDSEGSYKRTMSPNARLDDPVLLKVTPRNPPPLIINSQPRYHRHELAKSQSSDALSNGHGNNRMDDHFSRKSLHNVSNSEEKRERLSPQSVEVLNDRNRQLERERRKLVASCEPTVGSKFVEEFYRESGVTTIEMTSQNVEMLNRRNVAEKQRIATGKRSPTSTSPRSPSSPTTSTTIGTTTSPPSDRKISSPAQTEQTGSNWDRKSTISSISSSSSSSNPSSPIRTSPPTRSSPTVEGLTLVQRTEVVLRVNTTNDVASQTEELEEKKEVELESLAKPRKKLQEEIECEELSRDLANQLGPNDKLLPILVPVPEHKKSTDYVVDLFRVEAALQPRPRPRLCIEDPALLLDNSENESECDKKIDSIPSTPVTPSTPSAVDSTSVASSTSPLSASSVYFTTSESKARFLTRYSQDVAPPGVDSSTTPDSLDLRQKKEELMVRLDKKLVVLRAEQEAVREEGEVNEALGSRVAAQVASVARPAEASKYRLHVEEIGKITSLLLGLSGRLARAENALYGMPADHPERKILESKRDKLIEQLDEAKNLKGNIDRRSVSVSAILAKYLSDDEYADYQHFINMKAKLIVDSREIQDKVKLGEEQLAALREAIDL